MCINVYTLSYLYTAAQAPVLTGRTIAAALLCGVDALVQALARAGHDWSVQEIYEALVRISGNTQRNSFSFELVRTFLITNIILAVTIDSSE
jgi:hypothetical protein